MPSEQDRKLLEAAKSGEVNKMIAAIYSGANINAADEEGNTALHWSVCNSNHEAINALINRKAGILIKNKQGATALRHALVQPNPNILNLLLSQPHLTLSYSRLNLADEFIYLSRLMRQGYRIGQAHNLFYQQALLRMEEIRNNLYPTYQPMVEKITQTNTFKLSP